MSRSKENYKEDGLTYLCSREESVVLYCKAGECMGRGEGAGSPVNAWGSGRGQE